MMSDIEKKEYFKWFSFYHDHFDMIFMTKTIATVEKDGVLGAGILVHPIFQGNFCMFNFITRNPFCDREFSDKATDFLIQNLEGIANDFGFSKFISLIGEEPAKARFRKNKVKEKISPLTLFHGGN